MIDGEAYGRYEEVLHPVQAIANWLGVDGVMGCASAGLADHLIHKRVIYLTSNFTGALTNTHSQTNTKVRFTYSGSLIVNTILY